jgi:hypothetical protein
MIGERAAELIAASRRKPQTVTVQATAMAPAGNAA